MKLQGRKIIPRRKIQKRIMWKVKKYLLNHVSCDVVIEWLWFQQKGQLRCQIGLQEGIVISHCFCRFFFLSLRVENVSFDGSLVKDGNFTYIEGDSSCLAILLSKENIIFCKKLEEKGVRQEWHYEWKWLSFAGTFSTFFLWSVDWREKRNYCVPLLKGPGAVLEMTRMPLFDECWFHILSFL